MTEAKLRQMLQSGFTQESSFVERKPDHIKDREARKTVVAFANSTPEGQESALFIGVDNKTGRIVGVSDPDATQSRPVTRRPRHRQVTMSQRVRASSALRRWVYLYCPSKSGPV